LPRHAADFAAAPLITLFSRRWPCHATLYFDDYAGFAAATLRHDIFFMLLLLAFLRYRADIICMPLPPERDEKRHCHDESG